MIKMLYSIIIAYFLLSFSGCSTNRIARFEPISFSQVDGWQDDDHHSALDSFKLSCDKILKLPWLDSIAKATQIGGQAIDWQIPCLEAVRGDIKTDIDARKFFEKWFQPYQVFDYENQIEGTLTGYFQIELAGSVKPSKRYRYPVYKRPSDLDSYKGGDSITHAAINNGALYGQDLEIVYVDNKARLYMMHIQGSGAVTLSDGRIMNLAFDDHNGYRFKGISEALKKRDLKFSNSAEMLNFLHKNHVEGQKIMQDDPSYVFFRKIDGQSAVGGHGVPLKHERSLAIDYGLYPYGTPIWVSTKLPQSSIFKGRHYKRLFIAQDTGGVIRGPIRGDVFFGRGDAAEKVANHFKAKGQFIALFPKTAHIPKTYHLQ